MPVGPVYGLDPCPKYAVPLLRQDGSTDVGWWRFWSSLRISPASAAGLIVCVQAQIAALLPTLGPNTVIAVSDYPHLMLWSGLKLSFLDEGSNTFGFSDVAAPSWALLGGPDGPWVACDGSTVHYLKSDGTLGTRTLPDIAGGSYFLELGGALGAGSLVPEVPGTVTGTCSVSGSVTVSSISVTGTCTLTSLTGTCTFSNGSGTTAGADAVFSSPTADGSGLGIGLSATTTGADASFSSPSVNVNGLPVSVTGLVDGNIADVTSASTSGSTTPFGGFTTGYLAGGLTGATYDDGILSPGTNVPSASNVHGDIDNALLFIPSLSYSSSVSVTQGNHQHDTSALVLAIAYNAGVPLSLGQSPHDHTYSANVGSGITLSGTNFAVTLNQSVHTHTISGIMGSGTIGLTTGGGTVSATGTGSGTFSGSGTISGSSSGAKPAAWLMQARFRI